MSLTVGTKLGSLEITALLGRGGMGEVYRARDTKLKRDVALKILPDEFSRDSDRATRFQREAEVLASLNHPNIAAIYDLREASGSRLLILELVEGDTLAERLQRGPIPVEEALDIAIGICEALDAAHEKGIIHRDLKPANVKLTPDGKVKVLDFGLAKAYETQQAAISLSNSPTLVSGSVPGVILGTAAYMSPEQAKGKTVDQRADIFAFGCVLFEMLSGQGAFQGETVSEILARVMEREPDWKSLPPGLPTSVHELLRRCLEKDPRKRRRDSGDIRVELEAALSAQSAPAIAAPPDAVRMRQPRLAWIVAAIAILAFALMAVLHFREKPAAPEMRVEVTTPSTLAPLEFALSPDGRYIAFVASADGPQRLWLRALDKTDAQPLAGTEGADYPFWSADSSSIGFYASGKLKRIDISGGSPQVLANTVSSVGSGTWNTDGTIIFSTLTGGPLSRINTSGGEPAPVTRLGSGQNAHRFPTFLPDGRHFLFYSTGAPEATGIYLASLDGGEPKRLTAADSMGLYLAPEMIVFRQGTTLIARHLDLKRGELTGEAVRLGNFFGSTFSQAGLSVSSHGWIAYRGGTAQRQLKWYDRNGKVIGVAGEPDAAIPLYPELSPDGRQVAVSRTVQGNPDIWLMDLIRGGMTRFTFDPASDLSSIWSPDGMRIAFGSNRKGSFNLYVKPSSGAPAEEPLLVTPNTKAPNDWSKDGRFLLYMEVGEKNQFDLWALPVPGSDRKPIAIAKTTFNELNGQFSPDSHWVAYETNESGQFQIVVQPFPEPTSKWQVSTEGGAQPRWRADGKELYFIAPDGKLMVTSITVKGSTFAAGTPVALFPASPATSGPGAYRQQYAVSRDGQFLVNQSVEASTTAPITIILNWKPKP